MRRLYQIVVSTILPVPGLEPAPLFQTMIFREKLLLSRPRGPLVGSVPDPEWVRNSEAPSGSHLEPTVEIPAPSRMMMLVLEFRVYSRIVPIMGVYIRLEWRTQIYQMLP